MVFLLLFIHPSFVKNHRVVANCDVTSVFHDVTRFDVLLSHFNGEADGDNCVPMFSEICWICFWGISFLLFGFWSSSAVYSTQNSSRSYFKIFCGTDFLNSWAPLINCWCCFFILCGVNSMWWVYLINGEFNCTK